MSQKIRGLTIIFGIALLFSGVFSSYAERTQAKPALPERVTHLKVALIDYRYVTLYDYDTAGAEYYEIYGYIGNKSPANLRRNKYRDFTLLESTADSRHRITRLNRYIGMAEDARAYFVVRAVNQAGAAQFSNIAYLKRADFAKSKMVAHTLSAEKPAISSDYDASELTLTISEFAHLDGRTLDYSAAQHDVTALNIVASDILIARGRGSVRVKNDFLTLDYTPQSLNNREFIINDTASREYVKLKLDWRQDEVTAAALAKLPPQLLPAAPPVKVSASIANNGGARALADPAGDLLLHFDVDSLYLNDSANYQVYYFKPDLQVWLPLVSLREQDDVTVNIAAMGYYLLVEALNF